MKISSHERILRYINNLQEIEDSMRDLYKSTYKGMPDEKLKNQIEEYHRKLIEEATALLREE